MSEHISLTERIKIEVDLATKENIGKIALEFKRSVSNISVEIKEFKYNGEIMSY